MSIRKSSSLYNGLLAIIVNLLLVYGCYIICRIVFLLVNLSYFNDLTASGLWKIFSGGLFFDTSAILYTNVLYIVLMLLPLHIKEQSKVYQQVAKWIFIVTNGITIIMNLMDTVYFQFTNKRTTASVFEQFSNEDNILGIIGIELVNHWYLTLLAIILFVCLYRFYYQPVGLKPKNLFVYYPVRICIFVAVIPLCIFGMRGGIGYDTRPITISNANQYVNRPIETAIVLNTPFSIYRTIGKKPFKNPDYFSDKEAMEQLFSPVHIPGDSVKFSPKNVVVLIMESFGKEYFGSLNKDLENGTYQGYTPFLDSLITQSLTFEYSFANGRGSIDAMPSVLSGIPKFVESFFLTPASLNKLSSIGGELKKKGYYTAFFHGAKNGSMGFEAYAKTSGFTDYFGRTEYGNDDDFDGRWAIWDEEFFQFYANKISTFKEPFAVGLFSATSHHPFNIPKRYEDIFTTGSLPIHRCIRYSDHALKRFFETASKQPWYENTLFVITADHTNQTEHPEYQTELGIFSVPIILYSPKGDLKGQRKGIAQQIDIMPTVLSYLGYDRPYISFGVDLLTTPVNETFAVNYVNDIYQFVKGKYLLQFDGIKTIAIYSLDDKLLKNNLLGKVPEQESMEQELKSIIQQYMERMNADKVVYE